jgi:hypothetical protein
MNRVSKPTSKVFVADTLKFDFNLWRNGYATKDGTNAHDMCGRQEDKLNMKA